MKRATKIFGLAVGLLALLGCSGSSRTGSDSGGIVLSIASFGTLPLVISASGSYPYLQIDKITVRSVVTNPGQGTSDLMKVEITSYDVVYERADKGTRVPPRYVSNIVGTVDPGGTFDFLNADVIGFDQFQNQPLKDLLDYGKDLETNSTVVRLKLGIRFYGKTLGGESVATQTAFFSLDVQP
jgi:hypothetical protein